jgi:hypothetical protein
MAWQEDGKLTDVKEQIDVQKIQDPVSVHGKFMSKPDGRGLDE